ncbi:MAG: hypothetical protein ACI9K5_002736, partial [Gammaproteobacteria bacterium]
MKAAANLSTDRRAPDFTEPECAKCRARRNSLPPPDRAPRCPQQLFLALYYGEQTLAHCRPTDRESSSLQTAPLVLRLPAPGRTSTHNYPPSGAYAIRRRSVDKTKQIGTTPSRLAAGILLALISAGCGAGGGDGARGGGEGGEGGDDGGGGGGGGGGTGGSEDGGTAADIPVGALAAELEVSLPVNDSFILSGTFPIPKGVMLSTSTEVPYQIADYDGTLLDTQVEIVTRYPESNDGADVVEVIARVRRDPSLSSGMRAHYQVFRSNQAKRPDPGAAGVEDLQDGPVAVPSTVRDLLDDPRAIRVSATDCFGNEYSVYPLEGNGQNTEVRRYGHARAQLSTFETMAPD